MEKDDEDIKPGEAGWRDRYYESKFGHNFSQDKEAFKTVRMFRLTRALINGEKYSRRLTACTGHRQKLHGRFMLGVGILLQGMSVLGVVCSSILRCLALCRLHSLCRPQNMCGWRCVSRYYPYHYAPCAADLVNLDRFEISFPPSKPFVPIAQLMGTFFAHNLNDYVLLITIRLFCENPQAFSRRDLPTCYQMRAIHS